MRIATAVLTCFCLLANAFGNETLIEGGLYSTRNENGTYSVLKILKLDPEGVHVRLYSNQFPEHPAKLDTSSLYMAGMNRKADESLGMGHAPISRKAFTTWGVKFIKVVPVEGQELEGYPMWQEASGGYF
ncbi:hypothetical protein HLB44_36525 [Aquincola sp. S2]|uniref:DUF4424 domain-containing protein n=1 Tax=Pseudaquabacterium terrae TaxID=2732868 RepID=A0ABX2EUS7_9BURK|nr:hypothetical protein [Aquabacterium terrae]NRF72470.1 hypothetical protein [Aquabacterium terrae]